LNWTDKAQTRIARAHLWSAEIAKSVATRSYANFTYQAGSWIKSRRVVAKVEWHPGELYPRVGFIVTNMSRPAERAVAFYNKRGTCEQWIKEGKGAIKWTRLSCRTFAANAVRARSTPILINSSRFGSREQRGSGRDSRDVAR
jgi:post-segregation antitoxin (ccd killing protein)